MKIREIPVATIVALLLGGAAVSACAGAEANSRALAVPSTTLPSGARVAASAPLKFLLATNPSDTVEFLTPTSAAGSAMKAETPTSEPLALSADALFGSSSAELTTAAADALRQFAEDLPSNAEFRIIVVGFTDTRGSESDNYLLGLRRAQSVAEVLIEALGNRADVRVISRGEAEASGITDEQMAADRKVVLAVTSL